MRNIKLIIEYDGKGFNGWQKQPDRLNIQGEIEKAIEEITGEKVDLTASGRTDAGVHSLGQTANFKTDSKIPTEKFAKAINSRLKKSIVIKSAEEVDEKFHSRYSVKSKTYRYIINNSENGTAIYRGLEYHVPMKLDYEKMNEAIKYFIGEHDFKAFKASGTSSKSSVRKILDGSVRKEGERVIIEVTGTGFLYNMVRIIVGTLMKIGLGIWSEDCMEAILAAKDRTKAGPKAEAKGLTLVEIKYL